MRAVRPGAALPLGVHLGDAELVGVGLVELLPAVVPGVVAADRVDGVAVEEVLGDAEAEVPAGGGLRDRGLVRRRPVQVEPPTPSPVRGGTAS
jgi:hypothetical protein